MGGLLEGWLQMVPKPIKTWGQKKEIIQLLLGSLILPKDSLDPHMLKWLKGLVMAMRFPLLYPTRLWSPMLTVI